MLNRLKYIATAGALAASVFSSVGIASASYIAGGGVVHSNPYPYYPTYRAGAGGYAYNNGTTSGGGYAVGVAGPYRAGYSVGTATCTNGYGCTFSGYGAGTAGGKYNNTSSIVRNGNGTCTIYSTTNYIAPGTTYWQTSTTSRVIHC